MSSLPDSAARKVSDRTAVVSEPIAGGRSSDRRLAVADFAELVGTFRRRDIADRPESMGCSKDSDSQDRTSPTSLGCRKEVAGSASGADCSLE